jgi:hypothetical protein
MDPYGETGIYVSNYLCWRRFLCFVLVPFTFAPQIFHLEVNQNNNSGAGLIYARLNADGTTPQNGTIAAATSKSNPASLQRVNITGTVHKIGSCCPTVV